MIILFCNSSFVLIVAVLIQFDRLCTLLGRSRLERAAVLELLQENALLVQGCWVASSSLVLSPDSRHLTTARDYIVRCCYFSIIGTSEIFSSVWNHRVCFLFVLYSFGALHRVILLPERTLPPL